MDDKLKIVMPEILSKLRERDNAPKKAFLGFDACIDYILRIVREKHKNGNTAYFSSSEQFGNFLTDLGNKSCGVELETKMSKIGGNMVIMANALGNLNVKVECLGTFGLPDILPVFRTMSENCSLNTIGETISANALEFDKSKVIMFDPGPYNQLTWDGIKNIIGIERLREMVAGKHLISFVNWSEIENSSLIWKGFLDEVLPMSDTSDIKPFFFTDFSDCSRRSKQEIQFAIALLGRFRKYFKIHLSLNQNEAERVASALDLSQDIPDGLFIKDLFSKCNADILVIHRVRDALAYDGEHFERCDTFLCKEPKVLTGGGDNFNAGYCYSRLHGMDLFQSLVFANAVSGSYVKNGLSPSPDDLVQFLNSASF